MRFLWYVIPFVLVGPLCYLWGLLFAYLLCAVSGFPPDCDPTRSDTVLFYSLAAGIVLSIFCNTEVKDPGETYVFLRRLLLSLAMVATGLLGMSMAAYKIHEVSNWQTLPEAQRTRAAIKQWPGVRGTLIEIKTIESRSRRSTYYDFYPRYRYTVDGHEHIGSRWRLDGYTSASSNAMRYGIRNLLPAFDKPGFPKGEPCETNPFYDQLCLLYRLDAPVTVYYDPNNPRLAYLDKSHEAGMSLFDYMAGWFLVTVTAFLLGAIFLPFGLRGVVRALFVEGGMELTPGGSALRQMEGGSAYQYTPTNWAVYLMWILIGCGLTGFLAIGTHWAYFDPLRIANGGSWLHETISLQGAAALSAVILIACVACLPYRTVRLDFARGSVSVRNWRLIFPTGETLPFSSIKGIRLKVSRDLADDRWVTRSVALLPKSGTEDIPLLVSAMRNDDAGFNEENDSLLQFCEGISRQTGLPLEVDAPHEGRSKG